MRKEEKRGGGGRGGGGGGEVKKGKVSGNGKVLKRKGPPRSGRSVS